jgi:DNA-binding transcriptional regulator YiaG
LLQIICNNIFATILISLTLQKQPMKNPNALRSLLHLNQEEISLLLGVSRGHWSMFEINKRSLPPQASQTLFELLAQLQSPKATKAFTQAVARKQKATIPATCQTPPGKPIPTTAAQQKYSRRPEETICTNPPVLTTGTIKTIRQKTPRIPLQALRQTQIPADTQRLCGQAFAIRDQTPNPPIPTTTPRIQNQRPLVLNKSQLQLPM